MGKISDGNSKMAFMKKAQAAPSAPPEQAAELDSPTPSKATTVKTVSTKLMGLKFMQRARQKQEMVAHQAETAQRKHEECFVYPERQSKGCVIHYEDTPAAEAVSGRMSFRNFNPEVEKANADLRKCMEQTQREQAQRDTSVSDAHMAAAIGRPFKRKPLELAGSAGVGDVHSQSVLKRVKREHDEDVEEGELTAEASQVPGPAAPSKKSASKKKSKLKLAPVAHGGVAKPERHSNILMKLKRLKADAT